MSNTEAVTGLHQGQPVMLTGAPIEHAKAAMIMIHGRGADAESILGLANAFDQPDFAYLAPQAAGNTWYPYSFLYPIEQNQPHLDSALQAIADLLAGLSRRGLPAERVMLIGFSQGACLAQEFAARNARFYGGVVGLSGGVIGPDGTPRNYPGSLEGTPVLIGCSDIDPHVPLYRIEETAEVFTRLGAQVDKRVYPGMGHTVNQDEVEAIRAMMSTLLMTRL